MLYNIGMSKEQKYFEVRKRVKYENPEDERAKKELACMHVLVKRDAEEFAGGPVKLIDIYEIGPIDIIDAIDDDPAIPDAIVRHFVFEIC